MDQLSRAAGGAGGVCLLKVRGDKAFTTMLMLGRNSASYCTHKAATAPSCIKVRRWKCENRWKNKLWVVKLVAIQKRGQETRSRETFASPFGGYSPSNRGSMQAFTLSSVNLGVACTTEAICSENWLTKSAVKDGDVSFYYQKWVNYDVGITHVTRLCCPRGAVWSTGFLPVRSSKRTTPKLYTSLFWVSWPVIAYLQKVYIITKH